MGRKDICEDENKNGFFWHKDHTRVFTLLHNRYIVMYRNKLFVSNHNKKLAFAHAFLLVY